MSPLYDQESLTTDKSHFPLYSSCNEYLTCAAPAVCASGTCQCAQAYQPSGTQCVPSAAPAAAVNGVYQVPAGVAPATFRTVYTDALSAVRPVYQPVVYYPQVVRTPVLCSLPPCQEAPQPVPTVPVPIPTAPPASTELPTPAPETTTTPRSISHRRLFDSPSIAYPGDYCELPNIVCVGGSFCQNNVCVCREGEIVENQQCVPVITTTTLAPTTEAPTTTTTTEATTTSTTTEPTTTPTTTTTTTTTPPPTTTSTTTTTTTTTEAPTTTTTELATTTTTTTEVPTTQFTTTTTTTTLAPSTTVFVPTATPSREEPGCTPYNCACNPMGCNQGQIVRINFVIPGQQCNSNNQCLAGSYCSGGTCRCANSFEQRGTMCIRRRK
uniref:EB domain-containing protein n=1 Tax=Caenorhabditis tropicalis TaxID=1561998 RepID=A0A1I7USK5_9PELO